MRESRLSNALIALFAFHGRIGRVAFIGYGLPVVFGFYGLVVFSIATAGNDRTPLVSVISGVAFLLGIFLLWPIAALLSKRLHDLNRSAWHGLWLLLWLVVFVGEPISDPFSTVIDIVMVVALIWLFAMPGARTAEMPSV